MNLFTCPSLHESSVFDSAYHLICFLYWGRIERAVEVTSGVDRGLQSPCGGVAHVGRQASIPASACRTPNAEGRSGTAMDQDCGRGRASFEEHVSRRRKKSGQNQGDRGGWLGALSPPRAWLLNRFRSVGALVLESRSRFAPQRALEVPENRVGQVLRSGRGERRDSRFVSSVTELNVREQISQPSIRVAEEERVREG